MICTADIIIYLIKHKCYRDLIPILVIDENINFIFRLVILIIKIDIYIFRLFIFGFKLYFSFKLLR